MVRGMRLRMMIGVLDAGLLATGLTAGLTATPAVAAPQPAGVEHGGVLQQLLDAEHAAGMPGVFAEVRTGGATWQGAAGVADVDTGRPVRPWFEHRVGSITKTFVATTVLQLVGEHRVRLDAPIGDYLPDVVTGDTGRQVTVDMLLRHTSGLGNYTDLINSYEAMEVLRTLTITPLEIAAIGLGLPRLFPPGTAWSYSNTNYILDGLLVERVTGHRVADEVGRRVLRPLGLRHTYFPGTDPVIRGPHANAYVPWPDGTLRDFSVFNMSWAWAAGELISTPQDLNRFYRALLTGRLLSPPLLAAMRTTVPMDPTVPELAGYGYGLYWEQLPCGRAWGHTGGVIGQTTVSLHSPDGSRQVTMGENLTFITDPQQDQAIALARARFLITALCGPQQTPTADQTATADQATAVAQPRGPVGTSAHPAGPLPPAVGPHR